MTTVSATQVRKEWSAVVDSVIRDKPKFIKRTRDYMFLSDITVLENLLSAYTYHAKSFTEDDGSITVALDEIDLAENGADLNDALQKLAHAILEYSEDYYKEFAYWSAGAGKSHLPYVFKALILNDEEKIRSLIKCRRGKN